MVIFDNRFSFSTSKTLHYSVDILSSDPCNDVDIRDHMDSCISLGGTDVAFNKLFHSDHQSSKEQKDKPTGSGSNTVQKDKPTGSGSNTVQKDNPTGSGSNTVQKDKPTGSASSTVQKDKLTGSGMV